MQIKQTRTTANKVRSFRLTYGIVYIYMLYIYPYIWYPYILYILYIYIWGDMIWYDMILIWYGMVPPLIYIYFERLLQSYPRWQPGILFDKAAQSILEYRWQGKLYTTVPANTVQSCNCLFDSHPVAIYDVRQNWYQIVLPRRDEGSGKPCAVDQAS